MRYNILPNPIPLYFPDENFYNSAAILPTFATDNSCTKHVQSYEGEETQGATPKFPKLRAQQWVVHCAFASFAIWKEHNV